MGVNQKIEHPFRDLSGSVFGRWTVQKPAFPAGKFLQHRSYWCRCECGVVRIVGGTSLVSGNTQSCGCWARERTKTRLRKAPFFSLYNKLKRQAAHCGRSCELSFEEFLSLTKIETCHYCRAPLKWTEFDKWRTKQNRGYNLDRLDNQKGYKKDNVVVCCGSCNITRGDRFTPEEFMLIGETIEFLRGGGSAVIHTFTGRTWNLVEPKPEDVCIEDLAHHLSLMCRFTGAVYRFYSIAEHSLRVCDLCSPENKLWALLHDSSEFATADVNRPLKYSPGMLPYRLYEKKTQKAIMAHFGLPLDEPTEVKTADRIMAVTEARDLLPGGSHREGWEAFQDIAPLPFTIVPMKPKYAEARFLERFEELTGGKRKL